MSQGDYLTHWKDTYKDYFFKKWGLAKNMLPKYALFLDKLLLM